MPLRPNRSGGQKESVPAVLGGLAVWRHNNKKKIINVLFVSLISYLPIRISV